jgi:DNA-binding MarR family transcriptional regulator
MKTPNETAYLLCRVAFLLQAQQDQVLLEQLGIGFAQYKILQSIHSRVSITQLDVANTLGQTEASISRQIKLLLKTKQVNVQVDKNNRRRHLLSLTTEGERILEAAQQAVSKFNDKLINLNEKQIDQLHELLSKIV